MGKSNKARLISSLLILSYLLNGCGLASKNKNNNNIDTKDDYSHELLISKMDEYKEKSLIQDLGLYNDIYPEFYIGSDTIHDDGILTGDLGNYISDVGFPINHYYLHLADMYKDKKYHTDENGNLIFTWDSENKVGDFDTTIISCQKEEWLKHILIEDKKDGKTVITRIIGDFGEKMINEIVVEKVLSENVHATIKATHEKSPSLTSQKDVILFNNTNTRVLTINYYGRIYTFTYVSNETNNNYRYSISLPNGITFDSDKKDWVSIPEESNDFVDYYNLIAEICCSANYEGGMNSKAIACFEQFLVKSDCYDIYLKGSSNNPWYTYVTELMSDGNYELALNLMKDESTYWNNSLER